MRKALCLLVLAGGCIEYQPTTTLPPAGLSNPRPLEASTQTDKLVQVQVPEVDILWVVDNSCSMSEEQTGIAQNNPVFMDFFLGSGLDYHIGVVSTDFPSDQGRLKTAGGVKWIDDETQNPSQIFSSMIQLGTGGSADERGRDCAYKGLEEQGLPGGFNEGFIREDAALHIVAVSDEDDHSDMARSEFVNYLANMKWSEDMITFSSIVSPNPTCPIAAEPGDEYRSVTNAIGGIFWSICDQDWVEVLEQLGIQASGLKREYFLSQIPITESIEVWVVENGVTYTFEKDVDWLYQQDRNSVIFNEYVPGALAEVFVEYDVASEAERNEI